MEEELKCQLCKQFFTNPVLLPCYHSLCLNCAVHIQHPIHSADETQLGNGGAGNLAPGINGNLHSHVSNTNFHGHSPHIVVTTATVHHHAHHHSDSSISSEIGSCTESSGSGTEDGSDKVSIISESDSGVVIYSNGVGGSGLHGSSSVISNCGSSTGLGPHSRPASTSYQHATIPNIHGLLFPPVQSTSFSLSCPICHKIVYFDENGAYNLPKYRLLQNVVDKYIESRSLGIKCQLCEKNPKLATIMCEQCEIFYCDKCRENCHPARGPLAKHAMVPPQQGKAQMKLKASAGPFEYRCPDHMSEKLNMYCITCKIPVCAGCLQQLDRKHPDHDVQPIQVMSKAQKTELSHNLQQLSEKAKSGTEFIQRLKSQTEKVNENCAGMEYLVTSQIDTIIEALQTRKQELISFIHREKEYKLRSLKSEVSSHAQKLQQTTALIQFCIEALKESDPSAYLQVGSLLLARVANMESAWQTATGETRNNNDDDTMSNSSYSSSTCSQVPTGSKPSALLLNTPRKSSLKPSSVVFIPEFDLTLDDRGVVNAIRQLNFIQMKPPGSAGIIPEECCAENNSVTVAWAPPPTSFVEGYVLEIDDGAGGAFREVYCGKETICTVDGLHFNSLYHARVKAFNSTGDGEYSEVVSLQTAEVAWFTFDQALTPQGVRLSNENCTVTSDSYEPRVVLGSVGFARGVHYWEYNVDKYDASADPSFGVARMDVGKEEMLGKDDKGWGMYIDHQRSWFIHGGAHSCRTEGGVEAGSTIGVLLDLERRQLTFYVNEEAQGPVAFTNLYGVFYPAVSINCNVTLTLHTGLDCPSESEDIGTRC